MPGGAYINSADQYGRVARFLHWSIALAFVALFAIGNLMTWLEPGAYKWWLYDLHKSIGVVVLGLVAFRIAWRLANSPPPLPPEVPQWQRHASRASHALLYASMIVMPLSAYAASKAGGYNVQVFGLFEMPNIVAWVEGVAPELLGRKKPVHEWGNLVHLYLSYGLYALVGIHAAAALWHHYRQKDTVLLRMARPGKMIRSRT